MLTNKYTKKANQRKKTSIFRTIPYKPEHLQILKG